MNAVISGDLIAFTSVNYNAKYKIEEEINYLFKELEKQFDTYCRIVKGDSIECYVPDPRFALRIALIIKSYIKTIPPKLPYFNDNSRFKAFKTYGVRLAIGIGDISRFEPSLGIIDGEAIYLSGRTLSELGSTSNRERVFIRNTLVLRSKSEDLDKEFEPILALLDLLLNRATSKQSAVLYYKLMNFSEEKIADILKVSQPTINAHSTGLGWNAIEKAVIRFEDVLNNL